MRSMVDEHGQDTRAIQGTGPAGRVTRPDVEQSIERTSGDVPTGAQREPKPAGSTTSTRLHREQPPGPVASEETVPLTRIRRMTGEHMVRSLAVAPHVMTAIEVDYEGVESARRAHGQRFKEQFGTSLTYLPFISRALVKAIGAYPLLNASVGDRELLLHREINLSIAVDLDFEGLVAPVVRHAEEKGLSTIGREIAELASRARAKKLTADDMVGGTFTVSNSGPFGTFMVAPVINQPQVGILSTDSVVRKPTVVVDEQGRESIGIHSMGMLVLSWDHRAFDGAYAAAFMRQVKSNLETFDWDPEM
jgi:2-oxoglutarate dehydrogenase E2 component (dihydrolipoamide succinyltransferase)